MHAGIGRDNMVHTAKKMSKSILRKGENKDTKKDAKGRENHRRIHSTYAWGERERRAGNTSFKF